MQAVLKDKPESMLERPDGIVDRLIDKQTGKLARPGQANTMFELFMQENAPTEAETRSPTPTQNTDEMPSIEITF